jgi:hypothetical protein
VHYRKSPEARATIVTAWVAEQDMRVFHRMRRAFFPGHRNYLSAHITLFHHLTPGVRDAAIPLAQNFDWAGHLDLTEGILPVAVTGVISLGKGTAYSLDPEPMIRLRRPLRDAFDSKLTSQDARPWKRPHITVQNKVDKATANKLRRHLATRFSPCTLRIRGLRFYRYDYGPWTLLEEVGFQ